MIAADDLQARLCAQLKRTARKLPGLHYGGLKEPAQPSEAGTAPTGAAAEDKPSTAADGTAKSFDMFEDDIAEIVKAAANRKFVCFLFVSPKFSIVEAHVMHKIVIKQHA